MSKYLFIDDSGSKEWDTPYSRDFVDNPPERREENRKFWRDNYFVLAGIHIDQSTIAELNPRINEMKKKYFGTKHVEIRSVHLRNPEKRKKHYIEQFGISEEMLKEFVEENWFKIFEEFVGKLQLQAFVLDKRYYGTQRKTKSCLEITTLALFDRVETHPNRQCQIIFDQMDAEIKSTNHTQGTMLKIANKEVDLGSFNDGKYSHTSVDFEKSSNSNFLQLADTVAYIVYRQFVDHGHDWEKRGGALKMYPYFDRITDNFYCHPKTSQVKGFGIIKIPDPTGIRWSKTK